MNETEGDENDGKRERVKAGRYLLLSPSLLSFFSLSLPSSIFSLIVTIT